MLPAGLAAVEEAKRRGTWTMLDDVEALVVPPDLAAALDDHAASPRELGGLQPLDPAPDPGLDRPGEASRDTCRADRRDRDARRPQREGEPAPPNGLSVAPKLVDAAPRRAYRWSWNRRRVDDRANHARHADPPPPPQPPSRSRPRSRSGAPTASTRFVCISCSVGAVRRADGRDGEDRR